ncbi:hypothetical protein GMO_20930 [Gluconobacter morbifer G707]|uniref:Uncharacterized protein n=1 Tax=Gluconobacter morbifer G707 TaxID=1088869 RepID=G6XKS7_9PROT|nr:hypothetical protein GMO_20930 [Gluconobacter morbifer G707]
MGVHHGAEGLIRAPGRDGQKRKGGHDEKQVPFHGRVSGMRRRKCNFQ